MQGDYVKIDVFTKEKMVVSFQETMTLGKVKGKEARNRRS